MIPFSSKCALILPRRILSNSSLPLTEDSLAYGLSLLKLRNSDKIPPIHQTLPSMHWYLGSCWRCCWSLSGLSPCLPEMRLTVEFSWKTTEFGSAILQPLAIKTRITIHKAGNMVTKQHLAHSSLQQALWSNRTLQTPVGHTNHLWSVNQTLYHQWLISNHYTV